MLDEKLMLSIEDSLAEIRELAKRTDRLNDAEGRLIQLLDTIPAAALVANRDLIRSTINEAFLRKRQTRLHQRLESALTGTGAASADAKSVSDSGVSRSDDDARALFRNELHTGLIELADRHLFQWPYYEALAKRLFEAMAPRALAGGAALTEVTAIVREEISSHSCEIFQRGFIYATQRQQLSKESALDKANSGLIRLLEIAASEYRRQLARLRSEKKAELFRGLCSSVIAGALLGRCHANFCSQPGSEQLLDSWKLWAHQLPFLTAYDLQHLLAGLPPRPERDKLSRIARPLAAALDEQVARATPSSVCVLRTCTYLGSYDRWEVTLVEPIGASQQEVAFHCYLSEEGVSTSEIESAVSRGMQLILLPQSESLSRWAWRHQPTLDHILIDISKREASERLRDLLSFALASIGSGLQQDVPLTYNFAKRFPLDKPDIGADFRVPRLSVRRLLDEHSDAGVRVWCSVRRSGKTTACQDLQTHQGPEVIITETCESTGLSTLKDTFLQATVRALDSGNQLSPGFVTEAIRRAADYDVGRSRIVFVLDEYESLFRHLESAAMRSESIRYKVVQPFLNQMVEFAQHNLIILLGLRPDAHYILMDQNQLSPYVHADQFPLFDFEQNRPDCEFSMLVRRVLTERVQCDDAFMGSLFQETGGHPVLTVNVLTELCDWLISKGRPLSQLKLGASDFKAFAEYGLSAQAIGLAEVYDVHRKFAQQGLSPQSRDRTPWLYAVLHVLRYLASRPGGSMSCSLAEIVGLIDRLGLDKNPGIDAQELVRGGAKANFFKFVGDRVKPRIRLYARLTASVLPSSYV